MRKSQLDRPIMISFSLIILFLVVLTPNSYSQNQALNKADRLYKDKCYAQAVPFYIEGLEEKKSLSAMTKLAKCYRITNRMEEAEAILEKVVAAPKAKPITYLYYGETLMSNGKYEQAKDWLQRYVELEPTDEKAQLRLEACDLVKHIQPFFEDIEVEDFLFNSDADDSSPIYFNNEFLFCSDRSQGKKLLKQKAGFTNRDFLKIYTCTANGDYTYEQPMPFSSKINELNKNTANPTFWKDKTTGSTEIYFVRNSFEASKNNEYNLQLFRAVSDNGRNWRKVEILNFCNKDVNYMHPSISMSGDTLFFVTPLARGYGGTDIYFSTRKKDNTWGKPQNLGAEINTNSHEGFPYCHTDGQLYFCSKGHVGFGGFDIFVTKPNPETGAWSKPINLGKPINSSTDDISICFAADGQKGAFTSSREGGDDDIFFFQLNQKETHKGVLMLLEEDELDIIDVQKETPIAIEKKEIQEDTISQKQDNSFGIINRESDTEVEFLELEAIHFAKSIKKTATLDDFQKKIETGSLQVGDVFCANKIQYLEDEFRVKPEIKCGLDEIVAVLYENPSLQIEFGVHTNMVEDEQENKTLSRYRAEAAVGYIMAEGISDIQISPKAYGAKAQLRTSSTSENQRIELRVVGL